MSWDRYLALSVRRRWVMHDELCEMLPAVADEPANTPNVGDDGESPGTPMRPKRFRR